MIGITAAPTPVFTLTMYFMGRVVNNPQGKQQERGVSDIMPKYFALVIVIFSLNYGLMFVFNERLGVPLLIAKLFTEASLFLFSYWAQRRFVY